jgi:outer membrane protein
VALPRSAAIGGIAVALALGAPSPACAQSLDVPAPADLPVPAAVERGPRSTVGLGVGLAPDYEGSEDYRLVPLWQARVSDLYGPTTFLELFSTRLTSNLVPHRNLRLGPMLQYIPKRGSVDNDRVDDLENVDASVMLGVTGGWDFLVEPTRSFGVFVEARGDVAEDHGWLVTPGLRGRMPLAERLSLAGSLSTTWASEDYMSAYFGIDDADAERSGLDGYDADASFKDVALAAALTYDLTELFQIGLLGRYARLLDDAADSPIVDDEGDANQLFSGVLVNVRF